MIQSLLIDHQVQEELAGRENEFEILQFLRYNFKASVGIERAPPPESATEKADDADAGHDGDEDQVRTVDFVLKNRSLSNLSLST